jgi:hypothetical protein
MLTVDPLKRIPMSSIKHHPCYRGTFHFDPPLASPSATLRSIQQELRSGVDETILSDLESLGWGVKDELRTTLLNGTASDQEKVFYKLLVDRKRARIHELSRLSPKRPTRSLSLGSGPNLSGNGMNNTGTPGIFEMEPLAPLPLPTIPNAQNMRTRPPMPTYNPAPYTEIPTGHPYSTPVAQQQAYLASIHPHQPQQNTNGQYNTSQSANTPTHLPQVPPSIMLPQHQPVVPPLPLSPLIPPSPHNSVSSSASPMPSPLPSPLPSPHPNLAPLITSYPQSPHYCAHSPPQTPTPMGFAATSGSGAVTPLGGNGNGNGAMPQVTGAGPGQVIPPRMFGPTVPSSGSSASSTSGTAASTQPLSPPDTQYPPALLFTTSPPAKGRRVPGDLPPPPVFNTGGSGLPPSSASASTSGSVTAGSASVPAPRRRLVFRPTAVSTPATGAAPLPGSAGSSSSGSSGNVGSTTGSAQYLKPQLHVRNSSSGSPPESPSPPIRTTTTATTATMMATPPKPQPTVRQRSSSAAANPAGSTTQGASTIPQLTTQNATNIITRPLNLSSTQQSSGGASMGSSAPASPGVLQSSSSSSPGVSPMYQPGGGMMFPPPMQPPMPLSINVGSAYNSASIMTPPGSPPHSPADAILPPVNIAYPSVDSAIPPAHRAQRSTSGGSRSDVLGLMTSQIGETGSGIKGPSSHVTHIDTRIPDAKTSLILPAAARGSTSSVTSRSSITSRNLLESPVPQVVSTPRFHRRRLVTDPNEVNDDDAMTPTTHQSPKTSWFSSIFARRPSSDVASSKISKGASGGGVYSSKGLVQITTEVTHVLGQLDIPFKVKKGTIFEIEYGQSNPTLINVKSPLNKLAPTPPPANVPKATPPTAPSPNTGTAFFRRNTAPAPIHKHVPVAEKSGKSSVAPGNNNSGSNTEEDASDALSQLTEPREPSPPLPSTNDEGKVVHTGASVAPMPTSAPTMLQHHSTGSSYLTPPARTRGLSSDAGSSYTPLTQGSISSSSQQQPAQLQPQVKFTIEIVQEKSKDLRCVKFQHKSGDLSTYQRIQKDIQQRLKL